MSLKHPLAIGSTLLSARTLTSFTFCDGMLAVSALGKHYILEGDALHHCAIDLVYGQCERIDAITPSPIAPLDWQVHSITSASRMPTSRREIAPFEGTAPLGWLLFETASAWHFWPTEDLLAVALTRLCLLFVYDNTTFEVSAVPEVLRSEFEQWTAKGVTARHYTQRNATAFYNLTEISRFHEARIRQRTCAPATALQGRDIKSWLSLSSKLPKPPSRKTWEIER